MTLRDLIELAEEWRTMRGIDISDYPFIVDFDDGLGGGDADIAHAEPGDGFIQFVTA